MKERPILFKGEMVREILANRKTQTRRIAKFSILSKSDGHKRRVYTEKDIDEMNKYLSERQRDPMKVICPHGQIGDRLWVRETWTGTWYESYPNTVHISYAADGSERFVENVPQGYVLPKAAAKVGGWVTPLFMPRWASRITLEITDVRVQRIQEISGQDVGAEGIEMIGNYRARFRSLWERINAKRGYSWESNPYVFALSFKRVQGE